MDAYKEKNIQKFNLILPQFSGAPQQAVETEEDLEIVYYQVLLGQSRSEIIFENEQISEVSHSDFHFKLIESNFSINCRVSSWTTTITD